MVLSNRQSITDANIENSVIVQTTGDVTLSINGDPDLLKKLIETGSGHNPEILIHLIKDKIILCKEYIYLRDVILLKKTINTIFTYGIHGIRKDLAQQLYFIKFILSVFEKSKEDIATLQDLLESVYLDEAKYIAEFHKKPDSVKTSVFFKLLDISQTVILDILFENKFYANIADIYNNSSDSDGSRSNSISYYFGLSSFNLHRFGDAYSALDQIKLADSRGRVLLTKTLAKAFDEINKFVLNRTSQEILLSILNDINRINSDFPCASHGCELVNAIAEVQIYAIAKKNEFSSKFGSYDETIQDNNAMQLILAKYYIEVQEFSKATEILNRADWEYDPRILFDLMFSNIMLDKFDVAISFFERANAICRIPQTIRFFLIAIKNELPEEFEFRLSEEVKKFETRIEDLFYLSLTVIGNKELFDKLFFENVRASLEKIIALDVEYRLGFAEILLSANHKELALQLLSSITMSEVHDASISSRFLGILQHLDSSDIDQYRDVLPPDMTSNSIDSSIRISDWFIGNNWDRLNFLRFKSKLLQIQKRSMTLLSCWKEIFKLTHDENDAGNVIALLLNDETSSRSECEYYLNYMKNTTQPRILSLIAATYAKIGVYEFVNFYSYKAIFFLNGEDDYEIFSSYISTHLEIIPTLRSATRNPESVWGSTVIILKDENDQKIVCLDDETELEEYASSNISFGAKHYTRKDPEYLKLQNKKKGDSVSIDGRNMQVIEIHNRDFYAYGYVTNRCAQNSDKSHMVAISIDENSSPEDIKKSLSSAISSFKGLGNSDSIEDTKSQFEKILESYHLLNNGFGLPIDALIGGDYNKYLDIFRYLLHADNQAFYVGEVTQISITTQKFVVSLSTLLLISIMHFEDLLTRFSINIIVPKSLTEFVRERVIKMSELQLKSPGTLVSLDEETVAMIPFENLQVDIWNAIYDECLKFEQIQVSEEERILFSIGSGVSADTLFSSLKCDKSQLDCLILAKKTDGALALFDDLFYRKIARFSEIESISLSTLICAYEDKGKAFEMCLALSKTNYLYSPIVRENYNQAIQIMTNLLKGDRKRQYYGQLIANLE